MTSRGLFRAERLLTLPASIGPVLGLDTGTTLQSIGLFIIGGQVVESHREGGPHGVSLPQAVEELLVSAGVEIRALRGIAVAIGPGSFTGLRVSLSYAKGLAAASGCPIAGIPSLDAIALCALEAGADAIGSFVCPILDARKGEIYTALYEVGPDGLEKLSDDLVVTLERFIQRVPDNTVFAGDQRAADATSLITAKGGRARLIAQGDLPATGRLVAALGAARLAGGNADNLATLEPLYVRPSEATLKLAGANRSGVGGEGLWSREKSISSTNTQPTTRS